MALYTPEEIKAEVLADKEHLLEQAYPQDASIEYAENATPVWKDDIIMTWRDLSPDYKDSHLDSGVERPISIYTLMAYDIQNYYQELYYAEINELVEERDEQERIKETQRSHTLTAEEFFGED
jgi:hypothetical protein